MVGEREGILRADSPPAHNIDVEGVPEALTSRDRWICWKWVRAENGKWTKVPVQPNGRPASSTDSATWSDFSTVVVAAERGGYGIGFVFNGDGLVGIDLDDCRETQVGNLAVWAAEILRQANTYAEVSPSETGCKLFLIGELPEQFNKQHRRPDGCGEVEIYRTGRFFCVTGQRVPGTPQDVQERREQLAAIYQTVSGWKASAKPNATLAVEPSADRDTALRALSVLDPGMCYSDWLTVGMSLHDVDQSGGMLSEWIAWSRESDKFVDGECEGKWRSFAAGSGVGIASLCKMADDVSRTWRPQRSAERGDDGYLDRICEIGEPPERPRLEIRTVRELCTAFTRLRDPLIDGLLRSGEVMNVISAPKFGKSWLVLDLALSVASGSKWLDRFYTRPGKVLLVDNELHPETLASRIPRVATARGLTPDQYENNFFVVNLRGGLKNLRELSFDLMDLQPGAFDLCILDAWYRLQPSGTDENSNGDVTELYNLLEHVARKIGCAFSNVHHSSKGNQSAKSVTDVGSGAGAQARAPDTHLILRQHEADNAVVVDAAVRSWPPLEPFCMRWDFPVWTIDDLLDPKDLKGERSRKPDGPTRDEVKNQKEAEAVAKVIDAYSSFPDGETQRVLRAKCRLSGQKFNEINDRLIADGAVQEFSAKKGRQTVVMYKLISAGQVGQNPQSRLSL